MLPRPNGVSSFLREERCWANWDSAACMDDAAGVLATGRFCCLVAAFAGDYLTGSTVSIGAVSYSKVCCFGSLSM